MLIYSLLFISDLYLLLSGRQLFFLLLVFIISLRFFRAYQACGFITIELSARFNGASVNGVSTLIFSPTFQPCQKVILINTTNLPINLSVLLCLGLCYCYTILHYFLYLTLKPNPRRTAKYPRLRQGTRPSRNILPLVQ